MGEHKEGMGVAPDTCCSERSFDFNSPNLQSVRKGSDAPHDRRPRTPPVPFKYFRFTDVKRSPFSLRCDGRIAKESRSCAPGVSFCAACWFASRLVLKVLVWRSAFADFLAIPFPRPRSMKLSLECARDTLARG